MSLPCQLVDNIQAMLKHFGLMPYDLVWRTGRVDRLLMVVFANTFLAAKKIQQKCDGYNLGTFIKLSDEKWQITIILAERVDKCNKLGICTNGTYSIIECDAIDMFLQHNLSANQLAIVSNVCNLYSLRQYLRDCVAERTNNMSWFLRKNYKLKCIEIGIVFHNVDNAICKTIMKQFEKISLSTEYHDINHTQDIMVVLAHTVDIEISPTVIQTPVSFDQRDGTTPSDGTTSANLNVGAMSSDQQDGTTSATPSDKQKPKMKQQLIVPNISITPNTYLTLRIATNCPCSKVDCSQSRLIDCTVDFSYETPVPHLVLYKF